MVVCERVFVLSVCLCMCCFLLATVSRLWAGEAQCSWQAPTTNADGIPLTDLQNYKIHYGTVSRGSKTAPVTFQYQSSVIISAHQCSHTLTGLTTGQRYYISITALYTASNESNFSNEVSVIAQDSGSTTALLRAHLDSGAEGVEYVEHALGDDNNKKMASDKTPTLPLDDVVVPTGGTIPAPVQIWLEAENGQLTSPMITGNDSTASSGQYIWTLESARDVGNAAQNGGTARDTVQVTTADTFVIWTRVYPSSDGNGAFYLAMDGKPSLTWDIPFPLVGSAAGQEAVSITSPTAYEVATIQVGHEQYIDRTYTVTALPPTLDGLVAIKTANGDRSNTSTTFLTLTLTADATLYVAYASLADPLPYWLTTGFTPTGLTIDTTDAPLSVWEREVSAGTVTLPGNKHGSPGEGGSNYIVLLEFHNGRRTPTWRWFQVAQDSTPVFFLEPGAHTLTVKHCRSGTKLDRLLVTNDLDFVPAD